MNTKHHVNESNSKGTEKAIECILCEEKFNSVNGVQEHISGHLYERIQILKILQMMKICLSLTCVVFSLEMKII